MTYGSGGVGTGNHLGAELLKRMAGIDLLHVPFRGISLAITALYSGDIDMVVPCDQLLAMRATTLPCSLGRRAHAELPDVPGSRRDRCRAMS